MTKSYAAPNPSHGEGDQRERLEPRTFVVRASKSTSSVQKGDLEFPGALPTRTGALYRNHNCYEFTEPLP